MQLLSMASTYQQMYHLEDAENLDGEAGVAAGAFLIAAVALFSVKQAPRAPIRKTDDEARVRAEPLQG
jgi:hypothetical protein